MNPRTAFRTVDVVIAAPGQGALRDGLEELAELWNANRFIGDADVCVVLATLRPDLRPAEVWGLWTDYAEAHAEWRATTGWAENLRKAAVKACDELIGDAK